jgi:general secretion pathway protein G
MRKNTKGFTLVELLIVVVIMAVLAATVIPEFSTSTADAQLNTTVFNLQTMRSQIQTYKAQHGGNVPPTLAKMTVKTNKTHAEGAADSLFGPYLSTLPEDAINSVAAEAVSASTPVVATGTTGGWLYNSTTGEVRINDSNHDHR